MNLKRGFFRLWIVSSASWVAAVAIFNWPGILNAPITPAAYVLREWPEKVNIVRLRNFFDQFDVGFKDQHPREIEFPNRVTLFVEKGVPDAVVQAQSKDFYERYSKPRDGETAKARLQALGFAVLVAGLPPLVVLCFGWVLAWVFAGFKRAQP